MADSKSGYDKYKFINLMMKHIIRDIQKDVWDVFSDLLYVNKMVYDVMYKIINNDYENIPIRTLKHLVCDNEVIDMVDDNYILDDASIIAIHKCVPYIKYVHKTNPDDFKIFKFDLDKIFKSNLEILDICSRNDASVAIPFHTEYLRYSLDDLKWDNIFEGLHLYGNGNDNNETLITNNEEENTIAPASVPEPESSNSSINRRNTTKTKNGTSKNGRPPLRRSTSGTRKRVQQSI